LKQILPDSSLLSKKKWNLVNSVFSKNYVDFRGDFQISSRSSELTKM